MAISSFFLHFQPAKVSRRSLKARTTLGLGLISLACLLILVKHRMNMRRLLGGTENQIGAKHA